MGQRASDDSFALRVRTVAKSVESKTVRAGRVGFHQALCEVSYLANPGGSAVVVDRWSRLGSGLRERRPLIEFFALWHDAGHSSKSSQRRVWGEYPIGDFLGGMAECGHSL